MSGAGSQERGPIVTDLAGAADSVRALLARRQGASVLTPAVVGVTGPVGAGKSTLALRLSGCVVSTDHYLPDYHAVAEHLRDQPEQADLPRLVADLRRLRAGEHSSIPRWCFHEHRRVGEQSVGPARAARPGLRPLVVVEGLFALHETVRPALDAAVFVDAPAGVRWGRWETLERTGVRGWGVEYARAFFDNVAEPTFARYAAAYRAAADVVVVNG
jgi:uridine kinase